MPNKQKKIEDFIESLKQFNETTNIYSKNAYMDLDFHIQDSLNIAEMIGDSNKMVVDLGSGGGFPSVIVAIQNPNNQVIAIESKKKKCNFLAGVKEALDLKNYKIINEDVHQVLNNYPAQFYTAKAFKPYAEVIKLIKKFARPNAVCIIPISKNQAEIIKKENPELEIKNVNEEYLYCVYKK